MNLSLSLRDPTLFLLGQVDQYSFDLPRRLHSSLLPDFSRDGLEQFSACIIKRHTNAIVAYSRCLRIRQLKSGAKASSQGIGAGERDRTVVCSLGSCRSTIELHPRVECGANSNTDEMAKVITVTLNGATRQLPSATTVAALIEEMGLAGKRIALERNSEIVPRSTFASQQLADGDKLEIVVAVGGG